MQPLPTLNEQSLRTLERNWSLTLAVETPYEAEVWLGESYPDGKGIVFLLAASFEDDALNLSGSHNVGIVRVSTMRDDQLGVEDKLLHKAIGWHTDMVAIFNAITQAAREDKAAQS